MTEYEKTLWRCSSMNMSCQSAFWEQRDFLVPISSMNAGLYILFIPLGLAAENFFKVPGVTSTRDSYWILKTPGWKEISGVEWDVHLGRVQWAPWITVCIALDTWRQKFGGGLGEGGTEIIEDKQVSDLTVCLRLLTNFVRIVKLFVRIWNFLLTYFLECFPSPPSSWLLREHLYSYPMTPVPCHSWLAQQWTANPNPTNSTGVHMVVEDANENQAGGVQAHSWKG